MPTAVAIPPHDLELGEHIAQLVDKPLAFVYYAYPWGEPGILAEEDGPENWQRTVLLELEEGLRQGGDLGAVRIAVASGNGVGKGALCAWLVHWFASTRPHGQGVVTANTQAQLMTKTWREVAKWHKLARNGHWFNWQATKYAFAADPETWFVAAIPWSEKNSEAFAGTHENDVLIILDEASAIPPIIWETLEGALTTTRVIEIAFGNPTRNTGRFKELFPGGRFAHRWITHRVDSRTCRRTNKAQLQQWIDDYGIDSDFVKIHVLGQHPSQSEQQFISEAIVKAAQTRDLPLWPTAPVILGVDVARTGANSTVFIMRQGSRIHWIREHRGLLTDETAGFVREILDTNRVDATFIDAVGIGAGVYDQLRHTNHTVHAVQSAARFKAIGADGQPSRYYNKRAQMWGRMREWLETVGCLPDHEELARQLQAPEYTYAGVDMLLLESKEDMLERGIASPDLADSLALTFSEPVRPRLDGQNGPPVQYAAAPGRPWQTGSVAQSRATGGSSPWRRR